MCSPAARAGDTHSCPAHLGGPVVMGVPTVLIGGQPATRAGDKVLCPGPPNAVRTGSGSVFIEKMPAARMGDQTFHGGQVFTGCPTVFIGGAPVSVERPKDVGPGLKRYRIRVVKGEADSSGDVHTGIPGLTKHYTEATITFQILDLATNTQAKFTFDWHGIEGGLALADRDRPGNLNPAPGEWKDFTAPDMPLEAFAGEVLVKGRGTFDDDLGLVFFDKDSEDVGDEGVIGGIDPGTDFDPDASPGLFNGLGELDYDKHSEGPYKGD
jgi:uncharacterized Zn-binding protein involved in type VI secretion